MFLYCCHVSIGDSNAIWVLADCVTLNTQAPVAVLRRRNQLCAKMYLNDHTIFWTSRLPLEIKCGGDFDETHQTLVSVSQQNCLIIWCIWQEIECKTLKGIGKPTRNRLVLWLLIVRNSVLQWSSAVNIFCHFESCDVNECWVDWRDVFIFVLRRGGYLAAKYSFAYFVQCPVMNLGLFATGINSQKCGPPIWKREKFSYVLLDRILVSDK